jgi:hypothetical protein
MFQRDFSKDSEKSTFAGQQPEAGPSVCFRAALGRAPQDDNMEKVQSQAAKYLAS